MLILSKTLALVIIASLLFNVAQKSWIRLSYEINKLEIIEKFCVNKDVKTYSCEGKCHLKAQLEEADETSDLPKEIIEDFKIQLFNYIHINSEKLFGSSIKSTVFFYQISSYKKIPFTIFHPPKF